VAEKDIVVSGQRGDIVGQGLHHLRHAPDEGLTDAAAVARILHRNDVNLGRQVLGPGAINGGAASRVGEAEKA
jgi:hypothetical protein